MDRVSTVDDGEMDLEEMPDLLNDESAEILESEVFKLDFLSKSDYSRAPGGPFKEEPTDDSSQSMFTMRMLAGQTELDESCVTHWQEPTLRARLKDRSRQEMRQFRRDNGIRRNLSISGQQWQNGKEENQQSYIWLSQCSATAGAITQPD
jgi:hypothetical protein